MVHLPPATIAPATGADGRVRYSVAASVAVMVAVVLSTELLFQPRVWRNFGGEEIGSAWLELLAQRLAVAVPIGLCIALGTRLRTRSALVNGVTLAGAIFAGASVGELLIAVTGSQDLPAGWTWVAARLGQWAVLAASVALLFDLWRRAGELGAAAQQAQLRRARLEQQLVQARLQTLRSQIEPHFLFNTLATVRRLYHTQQPQGARLLANFLRYLGATLPRRDGSVGTLGEEVDLVAAYLGVIEVRMAGRLQVDIDVEDALRPCEFPALAAATLVENAIKHGIAAAPQGGRISLSATRRGAMLDVVVADTGVGFGAAAGSTGSGIGLANIRSRLDTLYGEQAGLRLESNEPSGVRAVLRLPFLPSPAREAA